MPILKQYVSRICYDDSARERLSIAGRIPEQLMVPHSWRRPLKRDCEEEEAPNRESDREGVQYYKTSETIAVPGLISPRTR